MRALWIIYAPIFAFIALLGGVWIYRIVKTTFFGPPLDKEGQDRHP